MFSSLFVKWKISHLLVSFESINHQLKCFSEVPFRIAQLLYCFQHSQVSDTLKQTRREIILSLNDLKVSLLQLIVCRIDKLSRNKGYYIQDYSQ